MPARRLAGFGLALAAAARAQALHTSLYELVSGRLSHLAQDVLAAQRGPSGGLAVISGELRLVQNAPFPTAVPAGQRALVANGVTVNMPQTPTGVAWAPASP